ncbi:phospho-sugar mutase [Alkalibaculum sp. M08DMB]|uniref:Phosphoglucomutase n=1 Tax=Alkalibaculum sporogenes TaxID=2655001 RepID=A0A6A7K7U8_9FIRM|nr:phospho-sugar mutase [Alkalibaculum sporogenes]MPW25421.1 phospho-sugar mutase [Alkalibaculum sporogenes]
MSYINRYDNWINSEHVDEKTKEELKSIENNQNEIEDRFYKDLEFGTAGLRGIMGAGNNRMNKYTIGFTTQGLANYISRWGQKGKEKGVVIAYDSRNMSAEFAKHTALILCAQGIKTYLFESLRPVPVLSYAIRQLECLSGIVITASHNPPEYNGYKVYWKEGYQLTPTLAKDISEEINKIIDFKYINVMDEVEAIEKGVLSYISSEIDSKYNCAVIAQCLNKNMIKEEGRNINIVYSPLHGAGNIPVRKALDSIGFSNVYVVKSQEHPDGNFPTVKIPNPEEIQVFDLSKELACEKDGDIIIATDPDGDRVGVAYKNKEGEYINLTGNQIGCLLEYYILSQLQLQGKLPTTGVVIKSIVTTDLADRIANKFNINVENTLTGFKFIGEKIEEYANTKVKTFILGFEESYGYLVGEHARDKDAIVTSVILCEMALYYKNIGKNLGDILEDIYIEHGYYTDHIESIQLEGKEGIVKLQRIASFFRKSLPMKWADIKVTHIEDYLQSKRNVIGEGIESINLPKSNVMKIYLEDGSWFCIRPSGTEPKIKIYFSVVANSIQKSKEKLEALKIEVMLKVVEAQEPKETVAKENLDK